MGGEAAQPVGSGNVGRRFSGQVPETRPWASGVQAVEVVPPRDCGDGISYNSLDFGRLSSSTPAAENGGSKAECLDRAAAELQHALGAFVEDVRQALSAAVADAARARSETARYREHCGLQEVDAPAVVFMHDSSDSAACAPKAQRHRLQPLFAQDNVPEMPGMVSIVPHLSNLSGGDSVPSHASLPVLDEMSFDGLPPRNHHFVEAPPEPLGSPHFLWQSLGRRVSRASESASSITSAGTTWRRSDDPETRRRRMKARLRRMSTARGVAEAGKSSTISDDSGLTVPSRTSHHRKFTAVIGAIGEGLSGNRRPGRVFTDTAQMKEKVRAALLKPDYKVERLYHDCGVSQAIARSRWFEAITMLMIVLNSVWIGVETDWNKAVSLLEADPIVVVIENCICLYFQLEWWARFLAFRSKLEGFRDKWFAFDSALLAVMTFETWVFSFIVFGMSAASGSMDKTTLALMQNASLIRMFRLLRVARMFRIVKIFRTCPEIMVLIRAMSAALRTVGITLAFLIVADYFFAVAFTQLARGTSLEEPYFSSVIESMHTLLITGAFPDAESLMRDTAKESIFSWLVLFVFILFSAITIMNMMVGILVEVVKNAQAVEKESLDIRSLRDSLLGAVHSLTGADVSYPASVTLNKEEFWDLLDMPEAARVLQNTGVDVIGLVDLVDYIFQDAMRLPFTMIMDTVLQLRSSNMATVKDLVFFRKYFTHELGLLKKDLHTGPFGSSTSCA